MIEQKNETVDISLKQLFTTILQAVLIALIVFSLFFVSIKSSQKEIESPKNEKTQQQKDEEQQRMLTAIILMAG